ncbi:hypothetical protein CRUP_030488, partial [Coryphaenoides rupestris]
MIRVVHPVSSCVPVNYEVVLSVHAEGTDLKVKPQQSQRYVCRVNDQFGNWVFSHWVRVKVLDIDMPGLPRVWQGEPHIVINPESQVVQEGHKLTLRCVAFGNPEPTHYQWHCNGLPLQGKHSDTLLVERTTAEHGGTYLCSVANQRGERWTTAANIVI